jgi:hypothetical protein
MECGKPKRTRSKIGYIFLADGFRENFGNEKND